MPALIPLLLAAAPAHAAIEVAVIADSATSHADVIAQLEDDTWYDFEGTALSAEEASDLDLLLDYDVVIIGDSGYNYNEWDLTFAEALADWVDLGGGVVATGWLDYAVDSGDADDQIDAIVPVDLPDSGYSFCSADIDLDVSDTTHPITSGLSVIDLGSADYVEYSASEPDGTDAEVLATLDTTSASYCTGEETDKAGVVAGTYGDGRSVFLGPIYMAASGYSVADLRTGDGDQLLEQAVAWAAGEAIVVTDVDGDGFDSIEDGGLDCDDSDPDINPDAVETWYDGVDSDCAEDSDYDADGDGQDSADYDGLDCDDTDDTIYDGAADTWYDGIDSDCAGDSDYDADGDGQDSADYKGLDCDDTDDTIYDGAADTWYDGVDADCAGDSDYDADGDGYDSDAYDSGDGVGDDCDDEDAGINPGATDIEDDGIDQDCDGSDATSSTGDDGTGDGGADSGSTGEDGTGDDGTGDDGDDDGDKDEGCSGCASARTSGGAGGLALVGLLGLVGLRRRER